MRWNQTRNSILLSGMLAHRDRWIGWHRPYQTERLPLIAQKPPLPVLASNGIERCELKSAWKKGR